MPRWRRSVYSGLAGVLAFTACASPSIASGPRTRPPAPPGVVGRPNQSEAALEREIHDLVNRYRREHRLAPLTLDARITEQARRHSVAMATGRARVGHQGFEERIRLLRREMPVRRAAENAGMNKGYAAPARQMMTGWLASPTHRTSIEGPYLVTGIGVARNRAGKIYFTQIFVER
jgi:uncharacterized protein YkwD